VYYLVSCSHVRRKKSHFTNDLLFETHQKTINNNLQNGDGIKTVN
jgi:hypothetical protein